MPRKGPRVDLSGHRDFIAERIAAGITQNEIRAELLFSKGIQISYRTLTRTLAGWKIRTRIRRPACKDTPALRELISHCLHVLRLNDQETCKKLIEQGYDVEPRKVAQLRRAAGHFKRTTEDKRAAAEKHMEEILTKEFAENGVQEYGRKRLYKYMHSKYNIIGRDLLFDVANRLDPEGKERRRAHDTNPPNAIDPRSKTSEQAMESAAAAPEPIAEAYYLAPPAMSSMPPLTDDESRMLAARQRAEEARQRLNEAALQMELAEHEFRTLQARLANQETRSGWP